MKNLLFHGESQLCLHTVPGSRLSQRMANCVFGVYILSVITRMKCSVISSGVDDRGMVALGRMSQLRFLYLFGPLITDLGTQHLSRLSDLRKLNLNNTRITDMTVEYLLSLSKLVQLDMMCTGISDCGAQRLTGLTALSKLDLGLTAVTRTCKTYLQKVLQNTRVYI